MSGAYQTHGPTLRGLGYPIIPVRGKKPALNDWPNEPEAALNFDDFQDHNIGVLCGSRGKIVAVDIDVYDEDVSQLLAEKVRDDLGFAPQRIGQAPKTLFVFRTTEEIEKRKTAIFEINGQDCAVEVLGKGQQFVASGIHPETHKKYRWVDDTLLDVTVGNLTEVTPQAIDDFIAEANTLLAAYGTKKGRERLNGASTQPDWFATQELQGKLEEIEAAILHIPNDDWHYDDWVRQAHAIKSAVGDEGYDLFDRWSQRSDKYDAAETERVWNSIGEVYKVGAGSIFYLASEHGFDVGEYRKDKREEIREEKREEEQQQKGVWSIKPVRHAPPENSIKRREFVYGRHLIRGFVSVTVSPGGIGKTTVMMTEQIAMATGRSLLNVEPSEPNLRTLHINLEDPLDELLRRYYATLKHFKIDHEEVCDNVFLHSGRDYKVILADRGDGGIIQMPDADVLRRHIVDNEIDVVQIDPIIKAHYLDENSNKDIDELFTILAQIADDTKCAIDAAHHVRKAAAGVTVSAGDINQARGASALSGAVRAARTLGTMTPKEAEAFSINADMASWYVRIDNAKANMTAPAISADWFQRQSVELDNGDGFNAGDFVGVLEPWQPPDAFDGLTTAVIHRILNEIKEGKDGQKYSFRPQSNRWVGDAIVENALEKTEADAKQIVKEWRKSGLLFEDEYQNDETRKTAKGVFVDESKRPGNSYE